MSNGTPTFSSVSSNRAFTLLLAAAASHPALRSVLILDGSLDDLNAAAALLSRMLDATTGAKPEIVRLSPTSNEISIIGFTTPISQAAGCSQAISRDRPWRIVIIRDLASLEQVAARACVQLVDAEVFHVECEGQSYIGRPRLFWLAACARAAAGRVSPHLLDRFTIRLPVLDASGSDPVLSLERWLARVSAGVTPSNTYSDTELFLAKEAEGLIKALGTDLLWPPAGSDLVSATLGTTHEGLGLRRALTLARLTVALSRLWGRTQVGSNELAEVTALIGLGPVPPAARSGRGDVPSALEPSGLRHTEAQDKVPPVVPAPISAAKLPPARPLPVVVNAQVAKLLDLPEVVVTPGNLYPEDTSQAERNYRFLQLTFSRGVGRNDERGAVIGVRRAESNGEIAVVPTVLSALPFQHIRRHKLGQRAGPGLILVKPDLRAWRRAPVARTTLVLVLDATSYGDSDWQGMLLPYLTEAYVRRATLGVVLVGAAGAPEELRAERLLARNILVPALYAAMSRGPGRATPLADGLRLARLTLHEALDTRRGLSDDALLVVLSDGLGNVPLEASNSGRLTLPVSREGVEDALAEAQSIAKIPKVQAILLDPCSPHASHVTQSLASALGAEVVPIKRLPAAAAAGPGPTGVNLR